MGLRCAVRELLSPVVLRKTLLLTWNILMLVEYDTSEIQSFVYKRNNGLAGKCYIVTMHLHLCCSISVHLKPYSHKAMFCRLVMSFQEYNNIYCFFSQILTVSPSNFTGLFYCCSLLITVFASLTVETCGGKLKILWPWIKNLFVWLN